MPCVTILKYTLHALVPHQINLPFQLWTYLFQTLVLCFLEIHTYQNTSSIYAILLNSIQVNNRHQYHFKMSFMDKVKKVSRSIVDSGAKTMLKVRALFHSFIVGCVSGGTC